MERDMQQVRHFIWDFDGTLFDTYPVIIENLRSALAEYGRDCDPVDAMRRMLVTIPAARNHYADAYGIDREALAEAYGRYHARANEALAAQPYAGVREVLEHICAAGNHNYIFTHRKVWETELYLKKYGMEPYFREVVGPETPGFALKPAPDAVLYLMKKYGMRTEDTVMVGDRECDLGSGRSAGIGAVHLVCAAAPEDLVCDWRLEDFGRMLALLK